MALGIGNASQGVAGGDGPLDLNLGAVDEILVTRAEHHANLVPWQILAQRTGAKLRWLELTPDGRIDTNPALLAQAITAAPAWWR